MRLAAKGTAINRQLFTTNQRRQKIGNMLGNFRYQRRVKTHSDTHANTFLTAITIATTVFFWISS